MSSSQILVKGGVSVHGLPATKVMNEKNCPAVLTVLQLFHEDTESSQRCGAGEKTMTGFSYFRVSEDSDMQTSHHRYSPACFMNTVVVNDGYS